MLFARVHVEVRVPGEPNQERPQALGKLDREGRRSGYSNDAADASDGGFLYNLEALTAGDNED